jgi:hypothetical protein
VSWVFVDGKTCEVRWMWLPMFIAQNVTMMKDLEGELTRRFVHQLATPDLLASANAFVIEWLAQKFPGIRGLDEYLKQLSLVTV